MDAKPLRHYRPVPAPGNENLPVPSQSLHQRGKSLGNLKTMVNSGALNAAPRRTVFGDVSNIAKPVASDFEYKEPVKKSISIYVGPESKENCNATQKRSLLGNAKNLEQPVHAGHGELARKSISTLSSHEDRENGEKNWLGKYDTWSRGLGKLTTTNAKPAVQGSNRLSAATSVTSRPAAIRPVMNPAGPAAKQQALLRKAASVLQAQKSADTGLYAETASSVAESVVLEKQAQNPRHYKSQPQLKADPPLLRRAQSKSLKQPDYVVIAEEEWAEASYEDAVEQQLSQSQASLDDQYNLADMDAAKRVDFEPQQPSSRPASTAYYDERVMHYPPQVAAASEPEDHWDEEEDPELDDEPGYSTAHSYRSHGDNTTGGVTTMIAPRVTRNVQQELERAKFLVLQNQCETELEEERGDVGMVVEYGEEIFEYIRSLEMQMLPNPHYMDIQAEIRWSMRSVLMDWLVQVHHRFALLPETLFLTVNYIDRFLSVKVVSLGKLQLVGATALFLAAKYEEINCPSVQEIVYMVDKGYSVDEILKAERFMLSMLQYELGWPGPMSFLRRISKADEYDLDIRTMAKYLLEVTIMDERFVSSPPSFLAAGTTCLARMILEEGGWTPAHVHYSGYTLSQLKPLVCMIYECCQDPRKHHGAVYEKYGGRKYKSVALTVEAQVKGGFTLDFAPTDFSDIGLTQFDDDSSLEYERTMGSLIAAEC